MDRLFTFRTSTSLFFAMATVFGMGSVREARADVALALGTPTSFGAGCPAGSVSTAITPDQSSASFIFSNYSVRSGSTINPSESYKTCTVQVPATLPLGYRLKVKSSDYRGFASISAAPAQGVIVSRAAVTDGRGRRESLAATSTVTGPFLNDFFVQPPQSVYSAGCGGNVTIELFSSMAVSGESQMQMDSNDFAGPSVTLNYELEPCIPFWLRPLPDRVINRFPPRPWSWLSLRGQLPSASPAPGVVPKFSK